MYTKPYSQNGTDKDTGELKPISFVIGTNVRQSFSHIKYHVEIAKGMNKWGLK